MCVTFHQSFALFIHFFPFMFLFSFIFFKNNITGYVVGNCLQAVALVKIRDIVVLFFINHDRNRKRPESPFERM